MNYIDYSIPTTTAGTATIYTGFKGKLIKIECSGSAAINLYNEGVVTENILGTNTTKQTVTSTLIFCPASVITAGTTNPVVNSNPFNLKGDLKLRHHGMLTTDTMRILIHYNEC